MRLVLEFMAGLGAYMLKRWLGDEITKYIVKPLLKDISKPVKRVLIKSEHDLAVFVHYRHKAHSKKLVTEHEVCIDGACVTIKT